MIYYINHFYDMEIVLKRCRINKNSVFLMVYITADKIPGFFKSR